MNPTARPLWKRLLASGLCVLLALPLPLLAQVRLPALGEAASQDLSVSAERRAGEQIMREGRRDPAYLDDPVLLEYLQSLWNPLVAAARERGDIDAETDKAFAWEAFLVNDRGVNAFAMPGGYVGVHLGLIAITSTRDQLASVLAHELTHVSQRHIARSVATSQRASLLSVAAVLLGILAASRGGSADVANATIMGGQAAAIQGQLNFSRDMEREADRIGYGVFAAAGYAPAGMAEMFERLDGATRLLDNSSFPYLRSHPLTVDRISEARARTLLPAAPAPGPAMTHAVMQARARVLMDSTTAGLQRWVGGATASPLLQDRVAALYASALSGARLREHAQAQDRAREALQLARTAAPREPAAERALLLLQAELALSRGDAASALQWLDVTPTAGTQRPLLLLRGQAAVDLHRAQPAAAAAALKTSTEDLQTWVSVNPSDAAAWQLLASTADAGEQRLRALRAGAEARLALGDLGGAIDRFRAAQSAARSVAGQDFIEASVIDARLRQLQAERRQLALDARGGSRGGPRDPRDPSTDGVPLPDEPLPPPR